MRLEGIDTKSSDFAAMTKTYAMIDAVLGGTEAMRENSTMFLPKMAHESKESYDCRINSAVLANFFADAVRHIGSRPFGIESAQTGVDGIDLENFDENGGAFTSFAIDYFKHAVAYGEAFALCEMPNTQDIATLADFRAAGIRPYASILSNDSIIEYREDNGACTHLRVLTVRQEVVGFKTVSIAQIKVFEAGLITVYEQNADTGEWMLAGEPIATGLDFVPVVRMPLGLRAKGKRPTPPIIDAAYKQVEHLQASVALSNVLHLTAYPMLVGQGMGDGAGVNIETGPNAVLYAPHESRWELLEPAGTSITLLQNRLDSIERELMILCLQPFIPQSGNIAALVGEIQADKANMAVRAWVMVLEEALESILSNIGAWLGLSLTPDVQLDAGFGTGESGMNEVMALIDLWTAQGINRADLIKELQKRDLVSMTTSTKGDEFAAAGAKPATTEGK